MSFIGLGKCNKFNIYILVSVLSQFFSELLFEINSANQENKGRIFPFTPKIKKHNLFRNLIYFLSAFFCGIIAYFINKKNVKKKEGEMSIKKYEKIQKQYLGYKRQPIILGLFLTGFFLSLNLIIKGFFSLVSLHVGFWMFEIVYISLFSIIILGVNITIHKKVAMIIMVGPLLIIELINYFFPDTKHDCNIPDECNELTDLNIFDYLKKRFGVIYIPLLFVFYEITTSMRDYSWVKSKYLMDIRSLPAYKILLSIGIIGSTLSIIFLSIFSNVPCNSYSQVTINENNNYINIEDGKEINFLHDVCSLKNYDNNTHILNLYYDSFSLFFNEYKYMDTYKYLEIFIVIPLYFIFSLINIFSHIMMIRYTDPNNILISKNFHYFVKRIIVFILNKGNEKYITIANFIILEIEELISIISNMIYIEIIELRFCKLDYELKKNIKKRSVDELELGLKEPDEKLRTESEID